MRRSIRIELELLIKDSTGFDGFLIAEDLIKHYAAEPSLVHAEQAEVALKTLDETTHPAYIAVNIANQLKKRLGIPLEYQYIESQEEKGINYEYRTENNGILCTISVTKSTGRLWDITAEQHGKKTSITTIEDLVDLCKELKQCVAENCERDFIPNPSGKEQQFCSNSCKQKAYRQRKKGENNERTTNA